MAHTTQYAKIDVKEATRRLRLLVPPPKERYEPKNHLKWAVGIVAAPRLSGASYIDRCINSVVRAGFDWPLLFFEPGMDGVRLDDGKLTYKTFNNCPVTINGQRTGVFPNHLLALTTMRYSQYTADCNAYLLLEDDVKLGMGLQEYLSEYVCWPSPEDDLGALLLFTHRIFAKSGPGWHPYHKGVYHSLWGAQALAFSRGGLDDWLSSPYHREHYESTDASANRFADTELTRHCHDRNRPIHFAVGRYGESLVSHLGQMSSVFADGVGSMPGRNEARFVDATMMNAAWHDPPEPPKQKVIGGPRIGRPEEVSQRVKKLSRLEICGGSESTRPCHAWISVQEAIDNQVPQGCSLCTREPLKPTADNMDSPLIRCKLRKW